jgi:transcription antitermination factor NusG
MQQVSNSNFNGLTVTSEVKASEDPFLKWFAVYVQSRHEKLVATMFNAKGLATCLPLSRSLHKWSDRMKHVDEPIFPGYVFCRFNSEVRTPVLRTACVVQILGAGKNLLPLDAMEVASLQALERGKVTAEPWPFIKSGEWVSIETGPLKGLTGIVAECKKGTRVVVSISLLQRSVAVEVTRSQVRPAKAPFTVMNRSTLV